MAKTSHSKPYDLEERTLKFALRVRSFVNTLPRTVANVEDDWNLF